MKQATRPRALPCVQLGNPVLRKRATRVSRAYLGTPEFQEFRKNLIRTMRKNEGVGLAAPQVGVSLAIAVMEMRSTKMRPREETSDLITIINPKILSQGKETGMWEGCLSFMGMEGKSFFAKVPRARSVVVEYMNERGEMVVEKASGLWGQIFQHEIDHLNGIMYVDRLKDLRTLMTHDEYRKRFPIGKK